MDLQPGLAVVLAATVAANTDRYIHTLRGIHAQEDNAGNWTWPVQDALGTVRSEIDNNVAIQGSRHFGLNGSVGTPFGFTGEQTDPNDLINLRNRHYNPAIGTFTSLDPMETLNRYAYVNGNPVNFGDPSGLQKELGGACVALILADSPVLPFGDIVCAGLLIGAGATLVIGGSLIVPQIDFPDINLPSISLSGGSSEVVAPSLPGTTSPGEIPEAIPAPEPPPQGQNDNDPPPFPFGDQLITPAPNLTPAPTVTPAPQCTATPTPTPNPRPIVMTITPGDNAAEVVNIYSARENSQVVAVEDDHVSFAELIAVVPGLLKQPLHMLLPFHYQSDDGRLDIIKRSPNESIPELGGRQAVEMLSVFPHFRQLGKIAPRRPPNILSNIIRQAVQLHLQPGRSFYMVSEIVRWAQDGKDHLCSQVRSNGTIHEPILTNCRGPIRVTKDQLLAGTNSVGIPLPIDQANDPSYEVLGVKN